MQLSCSNSPLENLFLATALECDNTDMSDTEVHLITILILLNIHHNTHSHTHIYHMHVQGVRIRTSLFLKSHSFLNFCITKLIQRN